MDLDGYIDKRCYFVGTSGSTLVDMKVRASRKLTRRKLDTNLSVAAVAGLGWRRSTVSARWRRTSLGQDPRVSLVPRLGLDRH